MYYSKFDLNVYSSSAFFGLLLLIYLLQVCSWGLNSVTYHLAGGSLQVSGVCFQEMSERNLCGDQV